jgi:hypothetical protein
MGESNSRPQFGKLLLYHLTNPARTLIYQKTRIKQNPPRYVEDFVLTYACGGTGAGAGAGFFAIGFIN